MSAKPLLEFNKLNDLVSIYRPDGPSKRDATESTTRHPDLIIFCSWVGAASKHVAKYTDGYKSLFPNASILLIRSTVFGMFRGNDISPAFEIVRSFIEQYTSGSSNLNKKSIILHAFSNGGARSAELLGLEFQENHGRLPIDKIILDCCPGQAELSATSRAITLSLPNQYIMRVLGYYVVYLTMFIYMLVVEGLGIENTVTRIRRTLNDSKVFSRSTPRLYLYSKADTMVRFEDVHEHAKHAKEAGYEVVHEEMFEQAPHCALLKEGNAYWDSVKAHISS